MSRVKGTVVKCVKSDAVSNSAACLLPKMDLRPWGTRSLKLRFLRADTVSVEIKTKEKGTTIDRDNVRTTLTIRHKPLVLSKWKRKSGLPLFLFRQRTHSNWIECPFRLFAILITVIFARAFLKGIATAALVRDNVQMVRSRRDARTTCKKRGYATLRSTRAPGSVTKRRAHAHTFSLPLRFSVACCRVFRRQTSSHPFPYVKFFSMLMRESNFV